MIYIIHLIHSISTAFTIHGKNKIINKSEKNITELTKQIHQLQLENESLKKHNPSADTDEKSL